MDKWTSGRWRMRRAFVVRTAGVDLYTSIPHFIVPECKKRAELRSPKSRRLILVYFHIKILV